MLYSVLKKDEKSFVKNRGNLKIYIFITALPFHHQQHRRHQHPQDISAAAKMNHQNSVGKTRDKIIITPIAITAKGQKRLLFPRK